MTSGGSTGRPKVILDHSPAVVDTAAEQMLGIPRGVSLLNPGPLYHNAPFILSHMGLFAGGRMTGMVKFDAEEALRLIERNRVQWVNFVPTMMHRIWSLPEEVRNACDVSSLNIVFHMAAHRARPVKSISSPTTAPAAPITISAPSRSAVPTAGNRLATSAGWTPTVTFISAIALPT
jgi:acyl-CoA synthetase (AMP-forming)/AMP-acid ligase II